MKFNILKTTLLAGLVGFSSCADDYLEKYPSELLSADQINDAAQTKPYILIGNLNGLYSTLYTPGTGGTGGHDDFGQKGWDIYSDLLSNDMALLGVNYGWYTGLANLTASDNYVSVINYKPWRFYYRTIFSANNLIKGFNIKENGLPQNPQSRANLGQALALRAFCYYNLSLLYVEDIQDSNSLALPLYDEPTNRPQGLSPMSEVYDLMISDLTNASELLDGFERDEKFRVNQSVAQSLLAYVYAAKGDNENAAKYAKEVIDRGEFPLADKEALVYDPTTKKGGGFNDVNSPNWMWGQDLTTDIGLNLVSWWGQMDYFTYSYAYAGDGKGIDAGLYSSIKDDDIRIKQFSIANGGIPVGKFFDPNRKVGGQRTVTTDYVYMRIEEMYLLYAEASAKNGNESEAKRVLKELMDIRVSDSSYIDNLNGDDLLNEILLQSRIELWGEGKSYAIMKRNHQTRTRGDNHLFFVGESIQSNDSRLTLDIPQNEIINNPNISK